MSDSNRPRTAQSRRDYLKVAGAVGTGALAGCFGDGDGGDTIEIGAPAALTGVFDYLQEGCTRVGDLAIEQINEAGGPLDREFNWIQRDTEINPQVASDVVEQLITVDGVEAYTGLQSAEIPVIWDELQSYEVPNVTFWPGSRFLDENGGDNGTPEDTSDDDWVWRTMISDSVHTAGHVLNAADRGIETIGLMHGDSEDARSYADGIASAAGVVDGIEVATTLETEEGKSSYQSDLNRIFQDDFDALMIGFALEDTISIAREFSQGGYDAALMFEDGVQNQDLTNEVGDVIPEESFLALGGASGPHRDTLVEDFDEKYDTEQMGSDNHPWAIATYDAVVMIALAIHRAGEYEAEAIQQSIRPVTEPGGGFVAVITQLGAILALGVVGLVLAVLVVAVALLAWLERGGSGGSGGPGFS